MFSVQPNNCIDLPGHDSFSALENFKPGGDIAFANLGPIFLSLCESARRERVSPRTVKFFGLHKGMSDLPLITALNGRRAVTKFVDVYELLKIQSNGEPGLLKIENSAANLFYVRVHGKRSANLWVVVARWYEKTKYRERPLLADCGWNVNACSVRNRARWHAGDQVAVYE